jgi:F420-dependent oxidoreductase-like protein
MTGLLRRIYGAAMRFAIKTAPQHRPWPDMLDVWRAADEIELFESAWNFDHFYPIFSDDSHGPCLEAWTMLAAMAQATHRIRVGVLVTGIVYRHPAVLANMAATVDIISEGRLELGIGAGWNEEECGAYGIGLGTLTDRFDRFDEACEVLVSLLSNRTTDFAGTYFQLADAYCEPKPVQRPHPPIVIGGTGEKRTLRTAARWAQHWNYPGGTVETWQQKRQVLERHCADIGRDPAEITTSVHIRLAETGDLAALAEEAARWAEAGMQLGIVTLPPAQGAAILEPLAHALRAIS